MEVRTVGRVLGDMEFGVKMPKAVRATGVSLGDGQITLTLEADVIVTMSALARMWVKAYEMESDVLEDLEDPGDGSGSSSSSSSSSGSSSSSSSGSSSGSYSDFEE